FHQSRLLFGFVVKPPLALRLVIAFVISVSERCPRAHKSKASAAEPARTVPAFHSPPDNALWTAPMSFRRFVRRSGSGMKLSSDVLGVAASSGHFERASRITVTGICSGCP